jgi:nitrous oxide reductase accessory protein NosL
MRFNKIVLMALVVLSSTFVNANGFLKEATNKPVLVQDGEKKHWCSICGMKLEMFYKTSHIGELKDGTKKQYCSIRCLAIDMEKNKEIKNIQVVDAKTEKIIDAKKAFYLVGSTIKGTMSKISKLAFQSKADALEFQTKYQGEIVDYMRALDMAKASLLKDIMMVTKKKQKKIYPMGEKLFNKACTQHIDMTNFININELKAYLQEKRICKQLEERKLQAVSLYLWEVKRFEDNKKNSLKLNIATNEKCPVCGMFVYKYPKWATQIYFTHGDHEHHFSFDGAKDMMKFYLEPKKWGNYELYSRNKISKILVLDYYSQKTIDATKAYYVTNSDVTGPMGHELIAFEHKSDAQVFKKDHFGKEVLKFEEINSLKIEKLGVN